MVYENRGFIELAGKNNEVRIMKFETMGEVNTANGKSNKLNGVLVKGITEQTTPKLKESGRLLFTSSC